MNRFKTLKHKSLPNVYGVISIYNPEDGWEIAQSSTPNLHPITADLEKMKQSWKTQNQTVLLEQIEDYNFIEVELLTVLS